MTMQATQERWTPAKAVNAYNERRKIAEQRKAERDANRGTQITEAEFLARKTRVGRPPKYKPEYVSTVIELSEQGLSLTAIAGKLRVCREQLYDWGQKYPAFSHALKIAKAVRTAALETDMLAEDSGPRINARMFALKNAAPDEWSDKQNIEINQTVNVAVTLAQALDALSIKTIEGVSLDDSATPANAINDMRAELQAIEAIEARDTVADKAEAEAPPTGEHPRPVDVETPLHCLYKKIEK